MRKLFFLVLLMAVCAPVSFAQSTDTPGPEVFVGYSNLQAEGIPGEEGDNESFDDEVFGERTGVNGFNTAVTGYVSPRFGITGDFSFHKKNQNFEFNGGGTGLSRGELDTRVINLMGGPQVRFPTTSRVTPFVRALFGVANTRFEAEQSTPTGTGTNESNFTTSSTDFAMALGGGVDVRLTDRVGLRLLQFDYNPVFLRDRSVQVLGGAGAIQTQRLEGQRQDNLRIGIGFTFK